MSSSTPSIINPTSTPIATPQSSNNHSVALGVGIGVPLGAFIFAALAMLLYRDRRSKKAIRDLQVSMPNAKGAMIVQDSSEFQGQYSEENELPTGFDRRELPTGHEDHKMPVAMPRYEMWQAKEEHYTRDSQDTIELIDSVPTILPRAATLDFRVDKRRVASSELPVATVAAS